jgi:hypothetical protein
MALEWLWNGFGINIGIGIKHSINIGMASVFEALRCSRSQRCTGVQY